MVFDGAMAMMCCTTWAGVLPDISARGHRAFSSFSVKCEMAINTYFNSTAICHDRKISLLNRDYSLIYDTQFMSCTEN